MPSFPTVDLHNAGQLWERVAKIRYPRQDPLRASQPVLYRAQRGFVRAGFEHLFRVAFSPALQTSMHNDKCACDPRTSVAQKP
jgi:hypothetical protein